MPRLNHKKARTGCQRCKARKVKCDEVKPACSACSRHNVPCQYVEPAPRRTELQPFAAGNPDGYAVGSADNNGTRGLDPRLEVRLMHEWTAYTCQSFTTDVDFWRFQAPLLAMEHRLVLDAMFGLAALDLSRRSLSQWNAIEAENQVDASNADQTAQNADFVAAKRNNGMLLSARVYFDRAIDSHQKSIAALTKETVEAVYVTSILVTVHALFSLNESEDDARTLPVLDPLVWIRLADGTRYLCDVWRQFTAEEWLESNNIFFGRHKLEEEENLFREEEGKPFKALLTFPDEYEPAPPEDIDAYQKGVAYIALVYKTILDGSDDALTNCRRLVAMPSRLPKRFSDLVEQRIPRAMVLLAHAFALMELLSHKVPWFQGIAERQIPKIQQHLPTTSHALMAWPMKIAEGRADVTEDTEVRDMLSL